MSEKPKKKRLEDLVGFRDSLAGQPENAADQSETAVEHMSEDELIKGLKGLSPQKDQPVESPLKGLADMFDASADPNAIPPHFEAAMKKLEEYRKQGMRRGDQVPFASRFLRSSSDYPAFAAFVQERDSLMDNEKKTAKDAHRKEKTRDKKESAAERKKRSAEVTFEETGEEKEAKERTLDEAKKAFFRAHNKEKKKAGRAYREAAGGLSEKNRKRLINYIVDTTDIPRAVLERIHLDVELEQKKLEGASGNNKPNVDQEIDTLVSGKKKSERLETYYGIDAEIDAMVFGKK